MDPSISYADDLYHRYGRFIDQDLKVYLGEYRNGLRHGQGTSYFASGMKEYE